MGDALKEYVRISTGLNKYTLIDRESLDLDNVIKSAGDKDTYYGIYIYNEKHYNQWTQHKTLAGVTDVTTDKIVWDFDDQDNPEKARRHTLETIDRLVEVGIPKNHIDIYFSGNRGFHIILTLDNKRIDRPTYETVVNKIAGDLDTLDPTVKDQQRLIRMPFTKNQKTGLYDIPLTYDELNTNSLVEIKEKAKTFDEERFKTWAIKKVTVDDAFLAPDKQDNNEKTEAVVATDVDGFDLTKKPRNLSATRFALKEGFFIEGERNTALMILASTYKNQGWDKNETLSLLRETVKKQASRNNVEAFPDYQLQNNIIRIVYSPFWKGGQYTETNELLQKVAQRMNIKIDEEEDNLVSFKSALTNFEQSCVGWRERLITTGIGLIDQNVMIEKQMMCGFLGAPGAGKSSIALNFCENLSVNNKSSLFMSLDMPYLKVIARMLQKEAAKQGYSYDIRKIQDQYSSGVFDNHLKKVRDYCNDAFSNIMFDNKEEADLEYVEKNIAECKQRFGDDFNLVVIDYFEKIRGKFEGDPTTNASHIASRLSGIAKRQDVAVVVLLQPRKSAGDPRSPLDNYTDIKGSATIQQDCRVIMTMWRPGYNPAESNQHDKYASIAVVKANLGEQVQMDFMWDGFSGRISEMNEYQKYDFKELKDKIERQRREKESRGYW